MRLMKEEHPVAVINLLFFLDKLQPLTDNFKDLIRPMLKSYIAGKDFGYAKAGDEMTTALWVERGYVRLYRTSIDENGLFIDETIDFGIPQHILLAPECFFKGKKCTYHIAIAKGTVVIPFTRDFFDELKISVPEIKRLANMVLAMESLTHIEKSAMMRMDGAERYDCFIKLYGEAINQFFLQKHFASLLGISPVYLSKLRKKRNQRRSTLSIAFIAEFFYYYCEI